MQFLRYYVTFEAQLTLMAIMPSQYTIKTKVSEDPAAIMFFVVISFFAILWFLFWGEEKHERKINSV